MRRSISKLLIFCLLSVVIAAWCSAGHASSEDNSVQPLYNLAWATNATLSISEDGTAQCSGYIRAINTTDSISTTLTLYRKVGNSWFFVRSWSASDQLYLFSICETHNVPSGTYRVQLSGTIVAADGTTETFSTWSTEATYN